MRVQKRQNKRSVRYRSAPRHGISKQAVMSPLFLIRRVPRYLTDSKHCLHRIARSFRDRCQRYCTSRKPACQQGFMPLMEKRSLHDNMGYKWQITLLHKKCSSQGFISPMVTKSTCNYSLNKWTS
jgi:hypothetical protein